MQNRLPSYIRVQQSRAKAQNQPRLKRRSSSKSEPNPPYGSRGAFRKLTITVPQEVYEQLISEAARRKIARKPNHLLSALIREALVKYLEGLPPESY
jgi:hypothetical protein